MVSRRSTTVLVVDDDDAVRRQVARVLREAGYRVLVARDGEDALLVLADGVTTLDIAITDVHMPNMGGAELASVLLERNQALKVIFMSGDASVDLRQREQLSDRALLLKKPLDLASMLASIEAASVT
jgi:DNA-binding NtrC family response regulator